MRYRSNKVYHFYFSEQCKKDRQADNKPVLYCRLSARVNKTEYTHSQERKTDGPVYSPDERYLGIGVMVEL